MCTPLPVRFFNALQVGFCIGRLNFWLLLVIDNLVLVVMGFV